MNTSVSYYPDLVITLADPRLPICVIELKEINPRSFLQITEGAVEDYDTTIKKALEELKGKTEKQILQHQCSYYQKTKSPAKNKDLATKSGFNATVTSGPIQDVVNLALDQLKRYSKIAPDEKRGYRYWAFVRVAHKRVLAAEFKPSPAKRAK